jgi:antitoxin (DNA-binding transcriptional repressor) of toxin-antitoxin stability system
MQQEIWHSSLSGLLGGEEIPIAAGDKKIVRLAPVTNRTRSRRPGVLRGELRLGPEFFEPLPADELEAWENRSLRGGKRRQTNQSSSSSNQTKSAKSQ